MRLVKADIERFRSIENQQVPVNGLVVLFGPNSAGKTTVLEAVGNLLAQESSLRADPADENPLVIGYVMFDLPGADTPGTDDALLYRALLRGDYHGRCSVFGQYRTPNSETRRYIIRAIVHSRH